MNHLIINIVKLRLSLVESQAEIGLSLVEKSGDFGHSEIRWRERERISGCIKLGFVKKNL